MFDPWGGGLRELCERGFVNAAVRREKSYVLCPPFTPLAEEKAEREVTRRYFTHYGPATLRDAAYFFKKSQTRIRQLMQNFPVSSFVSQGKTYYFIENEEPCAEKILKCLFLAGFDPLMLGYKKQESVFLPKQYLRGIFNIAGIVMPAILINGEVAGRWKLKNGKLEMLYFRALSQQERTLLHETAQEIWQGVRIKEMTVE